ncbi:hypothetical protein QBC35DRAFT_506255 [Podospora australis]|uniref:Uncharacterized protein n=1 Tax=Podospora australis TaxID=1536484 RepID=A0AAN7AF37_9PEZI|nr:hypothetical protein QBC35DRAFT_506255 [Podospora australis]
MKLHLTASGSKTMLPTLSCEESPSSWILFLQVIGLTAPTTSFFFLLFLSFRGSWDLHCRKAPVFYSPNLTLVLSCTLSLILFPSLICLVFSL